MLRTMIGMVVLCVLVGRTAAVGQESAWRLVWQDDFERSEVGDAWAVGEGASIVDGQLRWLEPGAFLDAFHEMMRRGGKERVP